MHNVMLKRTVVGPLSECHYYHCNHMMLPSQTTIVSTVSQELLQEEEAWELGVPVENAPRGGDSRVTIRCF